MIASYRADSEPFVVSTFNGFLPARVSEESVTFEQFAQLAEKLHVADCPCCRYDSADPSTPSPKKCSGKAKAPAYGPFKLKAPRRLNENVECVTAFVIDLDHKENSALKEVTDKLDAFAWVAYTTHGHGALMPAHGPGTVSARFVVPLKRPVPAAAWQPFREEVLRRLGLESEVDPTCKEPARFYYFHSAAKSRAAEAMFEAKLDGGAIDTDAVLAAIRVERQAPKPAPAPAPAKSKSDLDAIPAAEDSLLWKLVKECRKNKARKIDAPGNREKVALLDKLIAGEPLSGVGGRDGAIWHLATILSNKWPEECTGEDFVRIARPSLASMELDHGESLDEWLSLAEEKFDRKIEEVRAHKADVRAERKATEGPFLAALNELADKAAAPKEKPAPAAPPPPPGSVLAEPIEFEDEIGDDGEGDTRPMHERMAEWIQNGLTADEGETPLLHYTTVENKDGSTFRKLTPDVHNLTQFLLQSPAWEGVIRYNEVFLRVEVDPKRFPKKFSGERMFPIAIRSWFEQNYRLKFSKEVAIDAIAAAAEYNSYDPVKDYLNGLVWDGVPRIDNFLIDYCRAATTTDVGTDITDHVRRVSSKFLIGAAARGLVPGAKMDSTLVLEGPQGVGKTSVLEALGGPFYTPFNSTLDKDAKIIAARMWVMELGELASIRNGKAQDEIKSFLTARREFLRPAYGRDHQLYERRAVTIATTNDLGYLVDLTGNRRYWPVSVTGRIDVHRVGKDRDQIWAEAAMRASLALAELEAGTHADKVCPENRWWLVGDEEYEAAREVARRLCQDDFADMIEEWFANTPPEKRPKHAKAYDLARDALQIERDRYNSVSKQVASALTRLKFAHKRVRMEDKLPWLWFTPQYLLDLPYGRKVAVVSNAGDASFPAVSVSGAKTA